MTEKIVMIMRRFMAEAKAHRLKQRMAVLEAMIVYPETGTMPHVDDRIDKLVSLMFEVYGVQLHWQPKDEEPACGNARKNDDAVCACDVCACDMPAHTETTTTTSIQEENNKEKKSSSSCVPTEADSRGKAETDGGKAEADGGKTVAGCGRPGAPCTVDEMAAYFHSRGEQNARAEAQACWKYNDMRGWQICGKPIRDWHWIASQWMKQKSRHPRVAPAQLTEEEMARNRQKLMVQQAIEAQAARLQALWNGVRNEICQIFPGERYMTVFHPLQPVKYENGTLYLIAPGGTASPAFRGEYSGPLNTAIRRQFQGLKEIKVGCSK